MNTNDYIDLVNQKLGWTDYRLAKEIGVSRNTISNYRQGKCQANQETAKKIAEVLDLPTEKVIFDIEAAKSKDPALKEMWKRLSSTAAIVALSLTMLIQPIDAQSNFQNIQENIIFLLRSN